MIIRGHKPGVAGLPHHAHVFEDEELYDLIKSAVNPGCIIYQPHQTQTKNLPDFEQTLKDHDLKCLNSAEHRVEVITLELRLLLLQRRAG